MPPPLLLQNKTLLVFENLSENEHQQCGGTLLIHQPYPHFHLLHNKHHQRLVLPPLLQRKLPTPTSMAKNKRCQTLSSPLRNQP
jgi:hypothetical protein